jgi:hypothetical protein
LNVGVSRKLGLENYSSVGASCNLEVELENGLLEHDLEGFHARVRDAYVAANQAVNDELARLQAQATPPAAAEGQDRQASPVDGPGHRNGSGPRANGAPARSGGARGRISKPATDSQVRAILAIARAQHADLEGLLRDEYKVDRPEALTLSQASAFIDQLKAAANI